MRSSAATGFQTTEVITDTRTLRFYYRLLPDNRVQIGSRSAITGADAANPRTSAAADRSVCTASSRRLKGIEIDYSWWGWVDVSHDMMPRIVQPDPAQTLFYALGYGGNGVSYSAQAGRRMAEMIAGKQLQGAGPADLHLAAADPSVLAVPPNRAAHIVPVLSVA